MSGWTGVDLDGTLAFYDHWRGAGHIGEPIGPMIERVRRWLESGREVRIFTARVSWEPKTDERLAEVRVAAAAISAWSEKHLGVALTITNAKDFAMVELWDDRCVQVETNTGNPVGERR